MKFGEKQVWLHPGCLVSPGSSTSSSKQPRPEQSASRQSSESSTHSAGQASSGPLHSGSGQTGGTNAMKSTSKILSGTFDANPDEGGYQKVCNSFVYHIILLSASHVKSYQSNFSYCNTIFGFFAHFAFQVFTSDSVLSVFVCFSIRTTRGVGYLLMHLYCPPPRKILF